MSDHDAALALAHAYIVKVDAGNWLDWEKNSFLDYQFAQALVSLHAECERIRPVYEAGRLYQAMLDKADRAHLIAGWNEYARAVAKQLSDALAAATKEPR